MEAPPLRAQHTSTRADLEDREAAVGPDVRVAVRHRCETQKKSNAAFSRVADRLPVLEEGLRLCDRLLHQQGARHSVEPRTGRAH